MGSGAFLALTERDTPTGSNRPEQAWMMCLFGSFSGENSFVIKTREIWKSPYPSTTGQSMMDLPLLCLSGLHWHPLVRKLWWRKALQGGFAHLSAHKREAALLPKHWPDFRTQVYGQGVKPERLEGTFRETESDPVRGGVSISVCQRNSNCVGL